MSCCGGGVVVVVSWVGLLVCRPPAGEPARTCVWCGGQAAPQACWPAAPHRCQRIFLLGLSGLKGLAVAVDDSVGTVVYCTYRPGTVVLAVLMQWVRGWVPLFACMFWIRRHPTPINHMYWSSGVVVVVMVVVVVCCCVVWCRWLFGGCMYSSRVVGSSWPTTTIHSIVAARCSTP